MMLKFLKFCRVFFAVLAIVGLINLISFKIADVTLEGTKQAVRFKRQIAREDLIFKQAGGKDIVLFLGSSKVAAGIIPEIFDRENGGKVFSYNLSLPALPIATNYYLLSDYIKHNPPPKFIVMTLNTGDIKNVLFPFYAPLNANVSELIRYSILRNDMDLLINYFLPLRFYWPEIKRYVIGKTLGFTPRRFRTYVRQKYMERSQGEESYHHDWGSLFDIRYVDFEKTSRRIQDSLKENRGYYYLTEQEAIGGALPEDYLSKLAVKPAVLPQLTKSSDAPVVNIMPESKDPYVQKFFDLAFSNGIKVLLISDYTVGRQIDFKDSFPVSWKQVDKKYNNVHFSRLSIRAYDAKYFSDPAHLNTKGAQIFTKEIAQEFKRTFY